MNNSELFDFSTLKNMPKDKLIEQCKGYIEQYLSKDKSIQFDSAFRNGKYDEAKHFLEITFKKLEASIKSSELDKVKNMITCFRALEEFPEEETLFKAIDEKEGGQNKIMDSNINVLIMLFIAIVIIGIIGFAIYLKNSKKTIGDILSSLSKKSKKITYTEKDKDMMKLIHELSVIYDTADDYMKSKSILNDNKSNKKHQ